MKPTPAPKPEVKPAPVPDRNSHIHVIMGDFDTPHMRGARSAIMSNINGWRTLTDNMYRHHAYCNKANQQVFGLALGAVNTASMQKVSTQIQRIHAFKVVTMLKLAAVGL